VVTEPAYVDIYQKGATVTMYFSAVLDAEPAAWGAFSGEQTFAGERSRTGVGAGLYLRFDTRERQQVGLKIGLSYTSVENARLNLEKEAARKDFDRVRREANDTWEEALGRLRVEGGLHDDRVKFYTGLFHALRPRRTCCMRCRRRAIRRPCRPAAGSPPSRHSIRDRRCSTAA